MEIGMRWVLLSAMSASVEVKIRYVSERVPNQRRVKATAKILQIIFMVRGWVMDFTSKISKYSSVMPVALRLRSV